jgi:cell division transport system ATP-binding protein
MYTPTDPVPSERQLIVLDQVEKRHGRAVPTLAAISLQVGRGELLRIDGDSGAGKTTLLRLIAALDAPSAGTLRIVGRDVERLRPKARAQLRRSIGILLHEPELPRGRSVLQTLAVAAELAGATHEEAGQRAMVALMRVGLDAEGLAPRRCDELARSDARRVALARALVNRPALLVLDDPGAGLDATTGAALQRLLEQFADAGVTVIASAPSGVPLAPASARTRVIRLEHGRLAS